MSKYINLIILFISLMTFSCSSSKSTKVSQFIQELPTKNTNKLNLELKLSMNINFDNNNYKANAEIKIAGYDSLSMLISSQFNLPVARIYSRKTYFAFYNFFEELIYEGNPNKLSLQEIFKFPVSLNNFIDILMCQPYSSADEYILERINEKEMNILFSRITDKLEYVLYSINEAGIIQYQKKAYDGSIITNISYANYKDFKNIYYPSKISIKLINANVDINVLSAQKVEVFTTPFSFTIPKSIQRVQITD